MINHPNLPVHRTAPSHSSQALYWMVSWVESCSQGMRRKGGDHRLPQLVNPVALQRPQLLELASANNQPTIPIHPQSTNHPNPSQVLGKIIKMYRRTLTHTEKNHCKAVYDVLQCIKMWTNHQPGSHSIPKPWVHHWRRLHALSQEGCHVHEAVDLGTVKGVGLSCL